MKKIVLVALLVSTINYSQELIKQDLGSFKELKVFSGLKVDLIPSEDSRIEIIGKEAEYVLVKMSNQTLKLSFNFTRSISQKDVTIKLYYKAPLILIDANEGSQIESEVALIQNYLELKAQEGAVINLPIKVKQLDVKSVTGSQIRLSGSAEKTNVEANTGASYYGYQVKNTDAEVNSLSGARVELNADGILNAYVRLGGMIYYKGSPEVLKTKKVMGGTIKKED